MEGMSHCSLLDGKFSFLGSRAFNHVHTKSILGGYKPTTPSSQVSILSRIPSGYLEEQACAYQQMQLYLYGPCAGIYLDGYGPS